MCLNEHKTKTTSQIGNFLLSLLYKRKNSENYIKKNFTRVLDKA